MRIKWEKTVVLFMLKNCNLRVRSEAEEGESNGLEWFGMQKYEYLEFWNWQLELSSMENMGKILGSELAMVEWVMAIELWDGSKTTEGAGRGSGKLFCDEDHVMIPSLKSNSTLRFPDISVISPI